MKTAVLASALLSSLALAVPVDKRAVNTYWQTDVVTLTATTTVWGNNGAPVIQSAGTASPVSAQAVQPPTTLIAPTTQPTVTSLASAANAPTVAATTTAATAAAAGAAGIGSIYQSQPGVTPVATLAPLVPPVVGQSYSGDGTIYAGAGGPGACGLGPLIDSDLFVAVPHGMIGEASAYNKAVGSPESAWCGVTVEVSYNGKTALAPVKDRCGGCNVGDIDTSYALFEYLTGETTGRLPFSWSIVAKSPYY